MGSWGGVGGGFFPPQPPGFVFAVLRKRSQFLLVIILFIFLKKIVKFWPIRKFVVSLYGQKIRRMKQTTEIVMTNPVIVTDMKKKVKDILMSVSWRDFANTYFQRSSSWFYHKMDGIDGNGGIGGFNEQEAEQMRGALIDLSNRIRKAAENI